MSFIGTFGMFTTARMGVYTAQQGLNLTGNNIANINTVGYTRQTLDIKSMNASGVDRYSDSNVRVGSGAYASSISQLRDPYLDIRYRTECASVGFMDTKLSNLNDVAAVLDEVGSGDDENGILSAQLSDLLASMEKLSEYTGQMEFDTQTRSSASALVSLFNSYAQKLDEIGTNAVSNLEKDVVAVNEILTNIRDLNTNIRKCDIHGSPALEMRDERNRLIDELSQYIKIDVNYEMEEIAVGVEVEKLSISVADHHPATVLLDAGYAAQLELITTPQLNPDYANDATQPKYLDKNGKPTDNEENANRIFDSNYDLRLTSLKDSKGRIQPTYLDLLETKNIQVSNPPTDMTVTMEGTNYIIDKEKFNELNDPSKKRLSWSEGTPESGRVDLYQLSKNEDGTFNLTITPVDYSKEITPLDDNLLYGSIQAAREFLTESGEFATDEYVENVDPNARVKRGLRYYQKSLDLLAKKFADTMNAANTGYCYDKDGNYVDENGNALVVQVNNTDVLVNKNTFKEKLGWDEAELAAFLSTNAKQPTDAGNLFSTSSEHNNGEGITASNISISSSWANGTTQIVASYTVMPGSSEIASTDNSNILHMIYQMTNDSTTFSPTEIDGAGKNEPLFTGSFGNMFGNISSVLGNDQRSTQIMLDNYYASAIELDTGRDSVSSVDLNDETVNMMQYQKSYSAACRLMTTMDEVLDKLINGTGR
ncbi:MAG: hypothetical protein IKC03_00125 [Oscillospiraceae bacterium]|nr:hypothetical protein [Oscillospiraceae bacterium]